MIDELWDVNITEISKFIMIEIRLVCEFKRKVKDVMSRDGK